METVSLYNLNDTGSSSKKPLVSKKVEPVKYREGFRFEAQRLLTFINWITSLFGVFPTELAKAGFYYTGLGDTVECFACRIRISNWNSNKDPETEHENASPSCIYKSLSVPMEAQWSNSECAETQSFSLRYHSVPESKLRDSITQDHLFTDCGTSGTDTTEKTVSDSRMYCQPQSMDGANNNDLRTDGLQSMPAIRTHLPNNVNRFQRNKSQDATELRSRTTSDATDMFPVADPRNPGLHPHHDVLRDERYRLQTFYNWPANAPVTAAELARAGFYFVGPSDRVQCVFCRGILRNWAPGDSAKQEHDKHFKACGFVLGRDVGNIPLPAPGDSGYPAAASLHLKQQENAKVDETRSEVDMYEETGIINDLPKHPDFAIRSKRLATFKNWPKNMTQTPEVLADCGFYSLGIADSVKCFFCDGGLKSWERNDDPWEEHAKWFNKCGYLRQQKGLPYVKEIAAKHPMYPTAAPELEPVEPMETSPENGTFKSVSGSQDSLDDEKVRREMSRPDFKPVFEMFPESNDRIRNVIAKHFADFGKSFEGVNELIEAMLADEGNNTSETVPSASKEKEISVAMQIKSSTEAENSSQAMTTSEPSTSKVDKKKRKKDGSGMETRELQDQIRALKEERVCKVCLDEAISIVFLPCGHMVCCATCAPALRICPICRESIKGNVKAYIA